MKLRKTTHVPRKENLADQIYGRLRQEIMSFELQPGDRFTETEVATRMNASRTPVREALMRLQGDGFVEVMFRSGWKVRPFDFERIGNLYDLRVVLELAALERIVAMDVTPDFSELRDTWIVDEAAREDDSETLCRMDETFHRSLMEAARNPEMTRVHQDISERTRVVRVLDYATQATISEVYSTHAKILEALATRDGDEAAKLLRDHIVNGKTEVMKRAGTMLS